MPPSQPRYAVQSVLCGRFLLLISPLTSVTKPLSMNSLSLFCLLQVQWASCKLLMSLGWPPFAIGIMWSIHFAIGLGYLSDMSTGLPHMPHIFWVAYIRALFFSNCPRWVPFSSGLYAFLPLGIVSPLCVTKNPRTVWGFLADKDWCKMIITRNHLFTLSYYHILLYQVLSNVIKSYQCALRKRWALRTS